MTKFSALPTEYAEADLDPAKDYLFVTRKDASNVSALSPLDEVRDWITNNASKLSVSSGTLTKSAPISISQTWNSGATTFTGVKVNVTDTASASDSLIQDWQVGGSSVAMIGKDAAFFSGGSTAIPSISFINDTNTGFSNPSSDVIVAITQGGSRIAIGGSYLRMRSVGSFEFASTTTATSTPDIIIARDAAGQLALRNGTNAQSLAVYGTYTNASEYERLRIYATASSAYTIASEAAGIGTTARAIDFTLGGTTKFSLSLNASIGILLPSSQSIAFASRAIIKPQSDGVVTLLNSGSNDFGRLQFGGTSSSEPALKKSSATLQARLADDSAFTAIQGKLTTDANAVSEAITPTHTLTLYDASGTAYKVAVQAA